MDYLEFDLPAGSLLYIKEPRFSRLHGL